MYTQINLEPIQPTIIFCRTGQREKTCVMSLIIQTTYVEDSSDSLTIENLKKIRKFLVKHSTISKEHDVYKVFNRYGVTLETYNVRGTDYNVILSLGAKNLEEIYTTYNTLLTGINSAIAELESE